MHAMDLDHPLNCLAFNLLRAAKSAARGFERSLRDAGLSSPQFTTLALLGGFGEMAVSDLAERVGSERTTMTRNLGLLEARGWIEPAPSKDHRFRPYRLTAEGRAVLDAAIPQWRDYQRRLVGRLGPERALELLQVLEKV